MKRVAIIPAAGMGKRMGAGMNKQYLLLDGMPILARTLMVFQQSPLIDEIYLVTPLDEIPMCREQVVERHAITKVVEIVAGGAERQNSVHNGLRAVRNPAADDLVAIHDGVRPFIPEEVLAEALRVAAEDDGALVAVPVKDTVKTVADGIVTATPPRETLWLAQTPQVFRYGVIRNAYDRAEAEGFMGTDDASLVERCGGRVRIALGDYRNIKITTPEDMVLAHAFLREREMEEK